MSSIAFITDQHFDEESRWAEHLRIMEWVVQDLRARRPTTICLGGDLFQRRPTPREMQAAVDWIRALGEIAEVVGVYGNHEPARSLYPLSKLQTRFPVTIYEEPAVHSCIWGGIACLPWPRREQLLATIGRDVPRETANDIAADALRALLIGMGDQLDEVPGTRAFLGHVQMRAASVSTGQPLAPGADFELGLEDLALLRADAYMLGHIHRASIGEAEINGAPCWYGGSPRRTAYGELEAKGYSIVDVGARPVAVDMVETPCARMFLAVDEWGTSEEGVSGWLVGWDGLDPQQAEGAEIRLRYLVSSDQRDAARAAVNQVGDDLLARGAVDVKIEEEVRATQRVRTPEVARATTMADKADAYWDDQCKRGCGPSDAQRPRLRSKLAQIEEEIRRVA